MRLIDEANKYYESFYTSDAIQQAKKADLDLVCFAKGNRRTNELPLCKIIDHGKWKYSQKKKEKQQNSHQKHVTKEVQFSLGISDHDIEHKIKQTKKFLEHNMDVKVVMKLFGRDRSHFDLAEEKMKYIVGLCSDFGTVHDIKKSGNAISIRLVPV